MCGKCANAGMASPSPWQAPKLVYNFYDPLRPAPMPSLSAWNNGAMWFTSSPTPVDALAADARKLASEGKDLSRVTAAIDTATHDRKRSVERSLDATLELSKLSEPGKTRTSKEFILAYQASNGETKTLRGVDFDTRDDKSKDKAGEARVMLDVPCGGEPVGKFFWSMKHLKECLADSTKNIIYRIAYID